MTTATKCIAVKTPYGNMYLELMKNGEQYKMGPNDAVTDATYDNLTSNMNVVSIAFHKHSANWISVIPHGDDHQSFLPITSNYGDQFPQ